MKCGKSPTKCGTDFQEVFKMVYCCSAYELLDGLKDEIKKVEECDQKDIEVFFNKMNIKLRNTQKVCPQYGYQSDKCSKLRSTVNQTDRLCPLFDGRSIHSFLHVLSYALVLTLTIV